MNTNQTARPLAAASTDTPPWAVYVYDGIAYLMYSGRLAATATATPARVALLTTARDRLNTWQAGRDAT